MQPRKFIIRHQWMLIPFIWLFFYLALNSMVGDSPTMDEQNHIARGIAYLRTGDPRLSLEHPPLINVISALPLLTIPEIRLPLDHPSWQGQPPGVHWYFFADQFLWEYNAPFVSQILFLARIPILFLTMGLALTCYHFARNIWGKRAAVAAFIFILFDPNIMAHGRYSTTDLGGTLFIFLAVFSVWLMWRQHKLLQPYLLLAGIMLGLAIASKHSALIFLPLLLLAGFLPFISTITAATSDNSSHSYQQAVSRRSAQLLTAALIAIFLIWAVYSFDWGQYQFGSEFLQPLNDLSGPLPTYLQGVEQILLLNEGGRTAFLLGETNTAGFFLYFPVAFAVKTPLPTLILFALTLIFLFKWAHERAKFFFLLFFIITYFLVILQSGLNIGYRHLLPLLPFIYVLLSGLTILPAGGNNKQWEGRWVGWSLGFALVGIAFWIHPHYLSYFNQAAGGPENGMNILIDSNIDWGQDLLRLREWQRENEVELLYLGWFGTARPAHYGVAYQPFPGLGGVGQPEFFDAWWQLPFNPEDPAPGVYAISVTSLWEFPLVEKNIYRWFRARQPDARIGYSILIYDVR